MGEDKEKKEKKEKKSKKKKEEDVTQESDVPKEEPSGPPPSSAPAASADEDEPKAADAKPAKKGTSNVFAMFNQSQIQEFKEAFTMIDQNRDGIIDESDLTAIYQQIGREPDPKVLKSMVDECSSALNFTYFLALFGDKLKGTDPESALRDAFIMFDPDGKGKLEEAYVKDLLMNVGDQFSAEEVKQTWKEAPVEGGMLDYIKFVRLIKRGNEAE